MTDVTGVEFRVLTVCTGNICRSPMMERLITARLADRWGKDAHAVEVRSAGTWGHEGAPMEPFAAACVVELGADPTGFTARELDADMVRQADLVLVATRDHRAAAVTLAPAASARCFTLLEFDRLLRPLPPEAISGISLPERMRALVKAAAGNRGLVPLERKSDDDIEDPYGAPQRAFTEVAAVIDAALRHPMNLLAA